MTKNMDKKLFSVFLLGIFLTLVIAGFASADVNFTAVNGAIQTISQGQTANISFKLNNTGASNVTLSINAITISYGSTTLTGTLSNTSLTITNGSQSPTITLTFPTSISQDVGIYTGTLTLGSGNLDSLPISIKVNANEPSEVATGCTSLGNASGLTVRSVDFTNNGIFNKTFGTSDNWFPFENISADIEVKNNGNNRVDSISLNWGLVMWNSKTQQWEWVKSLKEEKNFNLKKGDSKTITVDFKIDNKADVDLSDLTDGNNYRFYAYASGTDDVTGVATCAKNFKQISMVIENDFAAVTNIQMPDTIQCGDKVSVSADVWNIGSSDQDNISLDFLSNEKIFAEQIITAGNIDAFRKKTVSFTFDIPQNITQKQYFMIIKTLDSDRNVFTTSFNDDPSEFLIPFTVSGSCTPLPTFGVSAALGSTPQAGQPLTVKLTFANTGTTQQTLNLNTTGFENFANSASLNQNLVILNVGESRDVTLTLDLKQDASGGYTFYIEATDSNGQVVRQPVSITIQKSSFAGLGSVFGGNWLIWAVGILNVILVVVIIVVAVKVSRK